MQSSGSLRQMCRKIVAVGRNYKDHALELGNQVPSKPVIFMKPSSSIIEKGEKIVIPFSAKEIHHEVELGVVIGETISNASEEVASKAILGYVLALDMTDRDLQTELKNKGLPWTMAKCFDTSCPLGEFIPKDQLPNPTALEIWLTVNDADRQRGKTSDMLFSVPYLLSYISSRIRLDPGDILLTGTPSGVGPVRSGDVIKMGITGVTTAEFSVA